VALTFAFTASCLEPEVVLDRGCEGLRADLDWFRGKPMIEALSELETAEEGKREKEKTEGKGEKKKDAEGS
jgi:hypothetical protein